MQKNAGEILGFFFAAFASFVHLRQASLDAFVYCSYIPGVRGVDYRAIFPKKKYAANSESENVIKQFR